MPESTATTHAAALIDTEVDHCGRPQPRATAGRPTRFPHTKEHPMTTHHRKSRRTRLILAALTGLVAGVARAVVDALLGHITGR